MIEAVNMRRKRLYITVMIAFLEDNNNIILE